ncbi:MAG: hypothetical protein JXR03_00165 [Cyclobacteriaceae bacterium]
MKKSLTILGFAIALGACSTPAKTTEAVETTEEPTTEAFVDTLEVKMDSMVVETDSVASEAMDSVSAE